MTTEGEPVIAKAPGVLAGQAGIPGVDLISSIVKLPLHGRVILQTDGSLAYTPNAGYVGSDGFTYRIIGAFGSQSSPATVTIQVGQESRADVEAAAKTEAMEYIAQQTVMANMEMPDMQAVDNLVSFQNITATAILNGNWSDPDTWMGRRVPGPKDNVWIMPDRTVIVDSASDSCVKTVRITGTLQFSDDQNTLLEADTVVVDDVGTLLMGTDAHPIQADVTARMVFTGSAPPGTDTDPLDLSLGLISMGTTSIHGTDVTAWLPLATSPMAGDTCLELSRVPIGWKVGDSLALAGTHYTGTNQTQDERLTIASIDGTKVYLTAALQYNHDVPTSESLTAMFGQAPSEAPLCDDLANMTRNVQFISLNPGTIQNRGHVMFMHTINEEVVNAGFYGLGRTDKSMPISVTNPRGRYALHFHEDGTTGPAIDVSGVVVDGSPGWGIDNHSSNVNIVDSVVYGAVGADFATEDGDEVGSFLDDFAMDSVGSPNNSPDGYRDREGDADYGYGGNGFWLQSPTVALIGNVVSGAGSFGIIYYPQGIGDVTSNLSSIQLSECQNNTIYASRRGLRVGNSIPLSGPNTIQGLTSFNNRYEAFGVDYSDSFNLTNSCFIGNTDTDATYVDEGIGFSYNNSYVVGYRTGLIAGYGSTNNITNGYLDNIVDLEIDKNQNDINTLRGGVRRVNITQIQFAGGGIKMIGGFPTNNDFHPFGDTFDPEQIIWNGMQIYYNEQASNQSIPSLIPGLDALSNAQLQNLYGIAYAGGIIPQDAVSVPGLSGGVLGSIQTPESGSLHYVTTYDQSGGFSQVVLFDQEAQSYLSDSVPTSSLVSGWNLIQFTDNHGTPRIAFFQRP